LLRGLSEQLKRRCRAAKGRQSPQSNRTEHPPQDFSLGFGELGLGGRNGADIVKAQI
jgi:hypothetical protein